jgi:hypothetical protein
MFLIHVLVIVILYRPCTRHYVPRTCTRICLVVLCTPCPIVHALVTMFLVHVLVLLYRPCTRHYVPRPCTRIRCAHRIRAPIRNLVYACDGPKGPGLSEKISRCSWIFMKKSGLIWLCLILEIFCRNTIPNLKRLSLIKRWPYLSKTG